MNLFKEANMLAAVFIAIAANDDEKRETILARSYARTVDKIYEAIRDHKSGDSTNHCFAGSRRSSSNCATIRRLLSWKNRVIKMIEARRLAAAGFGTKAVNVGGCERESFK
jgi:hypothetical protein